MPFEMLRKRQLVSILSLVGCTSLLLLSCDLSCSTQAEPTVAPSKSPLGAKSPLSGKRSLPGQVLPITATAKLGNQTFELEVAKTRQQEALGLMYRTFLPSNRGMLFLFSPSQPVQFWMKHCRMSLDMIFLRQGKVIAISANTPPCTADPCPVYGPNEPIDQVIEIRGGQSASLGLTVGANVEVQQLKTPR
jgi:uncharacterized protein